MRLLPRPPFLCPLYVSSTQLDVLLTRTIIQDFKRLGKAAWL